MTELQVKKIGKVYEIALDERPIRVGRSSSNDIVLRSDRVSREHCVIELVDGIPHLRDLESRHGTLVNGRKVSDAPIRPGDRIGVGGYEIAFDGVAATPDAPDEDTLTERATELSERERTIATREHELDEGRTHVDETRAALEADRAMVERDRRDLEAREADLAQREQALAEEREKLAAENQSLLERDAERGQELARMTEEVASATASLDEERERAVRLADEVASLQEALDASHRETRSVTDRLKETETDNESIRKQAAHLSRQLERKSRDLTKTIDRAAALETALAKAEAARQVLGAQAGKAEALEAASHAVVAASDYLALVRQSVHGVEEQWIETDDIVDESMEAGEVDAFQVRQRENLARQLEIAHEARENAMSELQEAVARLGEAITMSRGVSSARRTNLLGG